MRWIPRANAGPRAARAQGRVGGRPIVPTPDKLAVARQHTIEAIAKVVGVSRVLNGS